MAKIVENIVVVKFSKLVKDDCDESLHIDSDIRERIENAVQSVVDSDMIVEIEKR